MPHIALAYTVKQMWKKINCEKEYYVGVTIMTVFFFLLFLCHCQETTHLELKQTSMLSAIASLTPYSDFNQSPRNMYQCQVNYL